MSSASSWWSFSGFHRFFRPKVKYLDFEKWSEMKVAVTSHEFFSFPFWQQIFDNAHYTDSSSFQFCFFVWRALTYAVNNPTTRSFKTSFTSSLAVRGFGDRLGDAWGSCWLRRARWLFEQRKFKNLTLHKTLDLAGVCGWRLYPDFVITRFERRNRWLLFLHFSREWCRELAPTIFISKGRHGCPCVPFNLQLFGRVKHRVLSQLSNSSAPWTI